MKDILFKLRILYFLLYDQVQFWKKEIWRQDLDEHFCCNGYMCGCQGITVREEWKYREKSIKNI